MSTINCSVSDEAKQILKDNPWMKPSFLLEEAIRKKAKELITNRRNDN